MRGRLCMSLRLRRQLRTPLLACGGSFAPPSALRPHLCTPPLLCGISFAPPLCFAPSTLHPPSILRPLLCGDKRISKTKESKRIFSCKNRCRYSRKRAKICRNFAKNLIGRTRRSRRGRSSPRVVRVRVAEPVHLTNPEHLTT